MEIEGYKYITHKLIQRVWGAECRFTVARLTDGSHINDVIEIGDMGISEADLIIRISARLAKIKEIKDYEALVCHYLDDVGIEVREALHWLVRKIRQYPNATYAQAETAWNAEFADSLFTFAKLTSYVQRRISSGITWLAFKTYVINHHFEGID